ncbi:MAG TPA: MbnH family di-heme enzyme [Polyangiaceae bacterium]
MTPARVALAAATGVAWALAAGCGDETSRSGTEPGGTASGGAAGSGPGDAGRPNEGGAPSGGTATGGSSQAGDGGENGATSGAGGRGAATNGGSSDGGARDPGGEGGEGGAPAPLYDWKLPKGFPTPVVPAENPMSEAKVELGRHLFYDQRLSGNQTQACASCHRQELAFSDAGRVPLGSTGIAHPRNSMGLANVAYAATLTWGNPLLFTLESQALVPMFGTEPVELGLNGREAELLERLRAAPRYPELFAAAYPNDDEPFTLANVTRALASFQRSLLSGNSPFDRATYHGETDALSDSAKRGRVLFNSEKLECFHCHVGFNLQDSVNFVGKAFLETPFHNTALYNVDGQGAYPAPNTGIFELTGRPADMGRFRVPTLRNVAVTAPYMHDGSIDTLDAVLDHYAAGGRTVPSGPNAGNGSASPLKSPFMVGFTLTAEERADVLAFLESLTDQDFLKNPRFSDPWRP